MAKSALAKARDRWLASDTGKSCCAGKTEGQYLQNRLEKAFITGWDARERSTRHSDIALKGE